MLSEECKISMNPIVRRAIKGKLFKEIAFRTNVPSPL
jgi:hypothetical protein